MNELEKEMVDIYNMLYKIHDKHVDPNKLLGVIIKLRILLKDRELV